MSKRWIVQMICYTLACIGIGMMCSYFEFEINNYQNSITVFVGLGMIVVFMTIFVVLLFFGDKELK